MKYGTKKKMYINDECWKNETKATVRAPSSVKILIFFCARLPVDFAAKHHTMLYMNFLILHVVLFVDTVNMHFDRFESIE